MLEGKAVVRKTDMPEAMQNHVMELAYQALDLHEVSDCQSIAHYIKQDFTESREEAVGVLQKAERREDAICTAETGKSDPQNPFLKIKTQSTTKKVGNQNMLGTFNL
ncbi:uncharacterized protein LOC115953824 isoform X1 [Quercus lobata]|uniref:uncharacterized protein LOC115953824 isoform X1 n=1 Tax=Quercus lobata TaxID=97700 RepID=UPI001244309D|nr:uncharacterized protein LOC115953824 isoform X1 [Quercus lobata]